MPPQQVASIHFPGERPGVDWDRLAAATAKLWEALGGARQAPVNFVPIPDENRVAIIPASPDPGEHGHRQRSDEELGCQDQRRGEDSSEAEGREDSYPVAGPPCAAGMQI